MVMGSIAHSGEWKPGVGTVPSRDDRHKPITDIDRLDFLLKWMTVDDIGDYAPCPGVVVDSEAIEDALSYGPPMEDGRRPCLCDWSDDMRSVIDKAINSRLEARKRVPSRVEGHPSALAYTDFTKGKAPLGVEVSCDPVAEAIARKLSGIRGVPAGEAGEMIRRAAEAGARALRQIEATEKE